MHMHSKTFELTRTTNGVYALGWRGKRPALVMSQEDVDDLFKFLGSLQEGQEVVWMRRPQGPAGADDSWYPCHRTYPGAVMFVGPPR